MTKFSPTRQHGDCEEIANPSTAYGRRRRNWIDAHGALPAGQVVDTRCGAEPQPIPLRVVRRCSAGQGVGARAARRKRQQPSSSN